MEIRVGLLRRFKVALIVPVILLTLPLFAFAGGGQHYPNGAEAFLIGIAPPPGFYIKDYNFFYTANKLKDNSGNTLKLENSGQELDRLTVYGNIPRFIWITPLNILGGFYGMHLFVPVLYQDIKLDVLTPGGPLGLSDKRGGIGDLIYSPFIWTWHAKNGLLHMITALDIYLPTGAYNPKRILNIGKNFWTFEPVFAITGFLPPLPDLSASIKLMYDFNTPNDNYMTADGFKTHLTPGQEFHFDYSVEYALTKSLRLGVTGYFYQQTTDDSTGFGDVKNNQGRVFAIGPGVWYTYQKWFAEAHVAFETGARNRPEGITGLLTITHAF
jgi:hypothetical protein